MGSSSIQIKDSYNVAKRDFDGVLDYYRQLYPDSTVWQRSFFSLRMEWAVHNALYALGLWQDRTHDVDLDNPPDKPEWLYCTLGCLVWIFIK